jgi:arginine decarboxylase
VLRHRVVKANYRLGMRPIVRMRISLCTKHAGYSMYKPTANDKFGPSAMQHLPMFTKLKALGMLDCVQLLLFCSSMITMSATTTSTVLGNV